MKRDTKKYTICFSMFTIAVFGVVKIAVATITLLFLWFVSTGQALGITTSQFLASSLPTLTKVPIGMFSVGVFTVFLFLSCNRLREKLSNKFFSVLSNSTFYKGIPNCEGKNNDALEDKNRSTLLFMRCIKIGTPCLLFGLALFLVSAFQDNVTAQLHLPPPT